jgi:hypothetical protein
MRILGRAFFGEHVTPINFTRNEQVEAKRVAQRLADETGQMIYMTYRRGGGRRVQDAEPVAVDYEKFQPKKQG